MNSLDAVEKVLTDWVPNRQRLNGGYCFRKANNL